MWGVFAQSAKSTGRMKLILSFINHILLISRKVQLEGGMDPSARVVSVQSLCLNLKIDIYIHETPGGAHDKVMRGVL